MSSAAPLVLYASSTKKIVTLSETWWQAHSRAGASIDLSIVEYQQERGFVTYNDHPHQISIILFLYLHIEGTLLSLYISHGLLVFSSSDMLATSFFQISQVFCECSLFSATNLKVSCLFLLRPKPKSQSLFSESYLSISNLQTFDPNYSLRKSKLYKSLQVI